MKVASLFAGAGGLDLGFRLAGHDVVWANDFDPDSCKTYQSNIGDHIHCGDIANYDPSSLPDFDILIGGFPCQGFSRANVNKKENDDRNNLYLHVLRFLSIKKPKYFCLENVRGILTLNAGRDFDDIQMSLIELGYEVSFKVLNAADYGVPQSRVRVIIVGVREDLSDGFKFQFPEPTHSKDGKDGLLNWVTISRALEGIGEPGETTNLVNHVCSKYKVTNRDFTGHRRTDPNKPSPTILARGNGGGGVCAIQHPQNHRRLSVRESAIMQTFPLNFEFTGSLSSMYRQVGNAVPVALATAIAKRFPK